MPDIGFAQALPLPDEALALERAAMALGALGAKHVARRAPSAFGPGPSPLLLRLSVLGAVGPVGGVGRRGLGACLRDQMIAEALVQAGRPPSAGLHAALNALQAMTIGLRAIALGGREALQPLLIRQMHAALCAGLAVAGTVAQPRSGDRLAEYCTGLAAEVPSQPLLVRMAGAAADFTRLSPFAYGSDILARLLPGLLAASEGAPAVVIRQLPQAPPLARRWLAAFLEEHAAVTREIGRLDGTIDALHARWVARLSQLRSDSNARRLIDRIDAVPVLTVGQAERQLNVSFQTANAAVATLVEHRILVPHGGLRRNRVFVMADVFDTLDTPDRMDIREPAHAQAVDPLSGFGPEPEPRPISGAWSAAPPPAETPPAEPFSAASRRSQVTIGLRRGIAQGVSLGRLTPHTVA